MWELINAGGVMMWPLILCSVVSLGVVGERFWALQTQRVLPRHLLSRVWKLFQDNKLDPGQMRQIRHSSPLGAVLAAGLANYRHGRDIMKESIEEVGRQVAHDLERHLNTLGTIAAVSPLVGLLGTVLGIIKVFSTLSASGDVHNAATLARGISEALICTASGLVVAIPTLMFHRYFEGRVDELTLRLEEEALRLVEVIHGERDA